MSAFFQRFALGLIAVLAGLAAGKIFNLDRVDEVRAGAISVHYIFYVYTDSGDKKSGATIQVKALPLPDMKAKEPARVTDLNAYKLCYIVLVPAQDFNTIVEPAKFCDNVLSNHASLANVSAFPVVVGDSAVHTAKLAESGAYYVSIANCGNLTGFKLHGSVTVRHAYGLLPAIGVHRMTLYGVWFTIYLIITLVCGCMLGMKWSVSTLFQLHFLVVGCIAAIECIVWLFFYSQRNTAGADNQIVLVVATFASTWKVLVCFRIAFSAKFSPNENESSFWEEEKTNRALLAWSVPAFYLGFAYYYTSIMNFEGFSTLQNALPAIILTGIIVAWVEKWMSGEITRLKEMKYDAHASNLKTSQAIVGLAACGTFITTLVRVFDPILTYDSASWGNHAVTSGGLSQILFATALVSAMCTFGDRPKNRRKRSTRSRATRMTPTLNPSELCTTTTTPSASQ